MKSISYSCHFYTAIICQDCSIDKELDEYGLLDFRQTYKDTDRCCVCRITFKDKVEKDEKGFKDV